MLPQSAVVRLKGSHEAGNDLERMVCRIMEIEGSCTVSELVKLVAEGMYRDELKRGGWVSNIGIFGPRLFERDALALLDSMKDRCLAVESENSK